MVKNCDLGHSFSPYGPPSRQITYIYRFPERETQISSYFQKSLEVTFLNNGRMQTTSGRLTTQVVQKGQL